jgi:hypothetical protein
MLDLQEWKPRTLSSHRGPMRVEMPNREPFNLVLTDNSQIYALNHLTFCVNKDHGCIECQNALKTLSACAFAL